MLLSRGRSPRRSAPRFLASLLFPPLPAAADQRFPRESLLRVPGLLKPGIRSFLISPDGSRLAYISDDRVYIRKLSEVGSIPGSLPNPKVPSICSGPRTANGLALAPEKDCFAFARTNPSPSRSQTHPTR